MPPSENELLSEFADPIPYRTIGAVVHRHFVKKKILDMMQKEIITQVSSHLPVLKVKGKKLNPVWCPLFLLMSDHGYPLKVGFATL